MIEIRVDQLLEAHGRTFYWLAKETGISHTTLWRFKKGKALGINFVTLEKMCQVLGCQPGDLLKFVAETQSRKSRSSKKTSSCHNRPTRYRAHPQIQGGPSRTAAPAHFTEISRQQHVEHRKNTTFRKRTSGFQP